MFEKKNGLQKQKKMHICRVCLVLPHRSVCVLSAHGVFVSDSQFPECEEKKTVTLPYKNLSNLEKSEAD